MPSPFPGMNPYLERSEDWNDFHESFIPALREAIAAHLQEPYRARINENVYIHELSGEERRLIGRPDLHLSHRNRISGALKLDALSPAMAGVPEGIDILELNFLEILDKRDNTVVTTIELLSPCNKDGSGDTEIYRSKVLQLLRSRANFVEIDLLRAGRRMNWTNLTPCDYSIIVSRATQRPNVAHWPIQLRDVLPKIPIPLKDGDTDIIVDLQAILNAVYDGAQYGRYIYQLPPDPPLAPADAAWAAEILANAGVTVTAT
jgi:hypothetical protein